MYVKFKHYYAGEKNGKSEYLGICYSDIYSEIEDTIERETGGECSIIYENLINDKEMSEMFYDEDFDPHNFFYYSKEEQEKIFKTLNKKFKDTGQRHDWEITDLGEAHWVATYSYRIICDVFDDVNLDDGWGMDFGDYTVGILEFNPELLEDYDRLIDKLTHEELEDAIEDYENPQEFFKDEKIFKIVKKLNLEEYYYQILCWGMGLKELCIQKDILVTKNENDIPLSYRRCEIDGVFYAIEKS